MEWVNAALAVACFVAFSLIKPRGTNPKLAAVTSFKWIPLVILQAIGGVFLAFSVIGAFIVWSLGGITGWALGLADATISVAMIFGIVCLLLGIIVIFDIGIDWKADGPTFAALAIGPTLGILAAGTTAGDAWTTVAAWLQANGGGGLAALVGARR